jgi:hypothetical protein
MAAKLVRAGGRVCVQFACKECGKDFIVALDDVGGTFTCRKCGNRSTTPPVTCHYHPPCSGTYERCGGVIQKLSAEELGKAEAEAWKGESGLGGAPTDSYHDDLSDLRGSVTTYRCTRCGGTYSASYGASHRYDSGTATCQVVMCATCGRTPPAAELPEPDTLFNRALDVAYPYLWFDTLDVKVRQSYRTVRMTLVVAIGLRETGAREILASHLRVSRDPAFWTELLHGLVDRGLTKVGLVIADASEGLSEALSAVLPGTALQRCRADFLRDVVADVPRADRAEVKASVQTIFAQVDQSAASRQLREVARAMGPRWPKAAEALADGEDEALAYMAFPNEHWSCLYSMDAFRPLNRRVLLLAAAYHDIFANAEDALGAARSVSTQVNDEWKAEGPYFSPASMRKP